LAEKNISEEEYNGGTLADKSRLVEAFEKSKQGMISPFDLIRCSYPVVFIRCLI
jgi:hypothetical protein